MSTRITVEDPYVRIGEGTYLNPGRGDVPPSNRSPTLILISGWMGAKLSHLHKYTKVYEDLYPEAAKLLIRCEPSFFWSRDKTLFNNLIPAVEALHSMGCINADAHQEKAGRPSSPRVLVHVFSNGGCFQLMYLSRLISQRYPSRPSNSSPNVSAIVFDSCPGLARVNNSIRAFSYAFANPILRAAAQLFVISALFVDILIRKVLTGKTRGEVLHAAMNEPRLLPWFHSGTPRLYVYSKTDDLVPCADVESHALAAKVAGFSATLERFDDTPHVAHARENPARYWGAVEKLWNDACSKNIKYNLPPVLDVTIAT